MSTSGTLPHLLKSESEGLAKATVAIKSSKTGMIASGFFISRQGHLITAWHAVKDRLFQHRFPITIISHNGEEVSAEAEIDLAGCAKERDLALLSIKAYTPECALPLHILDPDDRAGIDVVAVGYPQFARQQVKELGYYHGRISRSTPTAIEINASKAPGQSGGPVYHIDSHRVIAVAVGAYPLRPEVGVAAILDAVIDKLPDSLLRETADAWEQRIVSELMESDPTYRDAAELVSRPPHYVWRNRILDTCLDRLDTRECLVLHGPPGVGKSILMGEVARAWSNARTDANIFYYQIPERADCSIADVVRSLSVSLANRCGASGPLHIVWKHGNSLGPEDCAKILPAICRQLYENRYLLCFDDWHWIGRRGSDELRSFFSTLRAGYAALQGRIVYTTWDLPSWDAPCDALAVEGFDPREVQQYLKTFALAVDDDAARQIAQSIDGNIVHMSRLVSSLRHDDHTDAAGISAFLLRYGAQLSDYLENKFFKNIPDDALTILASFAVWGRSATRSQIAGISGLSARAFDSAFRLLETSPPTVRAVVDSFEVHSLIRRAVGERYGKDALKPLHNRAAEAALEEAAYVRSARHYLAAEDYPKTLQVLSDYNRAMVSQGQVQDIEDLLGDLLPAIKHSPALRPDDRQELLTRTHVVEAGCMEIRGQYEQAIQSYELAAECTEDDYDKAEIHCRIGDSYRLESDYEAAARHYETALSLMESLMSRTERLSRRCRAVLGLAKIERLQCKYVSSLTRYQEALNGFRLLRDETGMSEGLFGVGEILRLTGRYPDAMTNYRESFNVARSAGNVERIAYACWGVGEIHRIEGRLEEARHSHNEGREYCEKTGDRRSLGWAVMGLAEVESAGNNPSAAAASYSVALRIFEDIHSETEIAHARLGIAEALRYQSNVDWSYYEAAEQCYRGKKLRHCLVILLIGKILAFKQIGDRSNKTAVCFAEAESICINHELDIERRLLLAAADANGPIRNPLNFP